MTKMMVDSENKDRNNYYRNSINAVLSEQPEISYHIELIPYERLSYLDSDIFLRNLRSLVGQAFYICRGSQHDCRIGLLLKDKYSKIMSSEKSDAGPDTKKLKYSCLSFDEKLFGGSLNR